MHRQPDAVVGDAVLRVVVGADFLAAVAIADLRFPIAGYFGLPLFLLGGIQTAAEYGHRFGLVLVLRAFILAHHHQAGGLVDETHGGGDLVHILPAVSAGVKNVNPQVILFQVNLNRIGLRQHGHGGRRGMDAPLRLRFRHPLHPMDAGLKLEAAESGPAVHRKSNPVETAQIGRVGVQQIHRPVLFLGKAMVHPIEVGGEQGRLLPAGGGVDLHDDIPLVVGVAGQQGDFETLRQLVQTEVGGGQLLLCHFHQLGVVALADQVAQVADFGVQPTIPGVDVGQFLEGRAFPAQLAQLDIVGGNFRARHLGLDMLIPLHDGLQLGENF